jgi:sterol desaturase/sphingolipid hydroxylase (fatty acid hydroxylase superfamily)
MNNFCGPDHHHSPHLHLLHENSPMTRRFISNRDETVPLFRDPWMERLSHVHPAVPPLLYLPVAGWFLTTAIRDHGAWQVLLQLLLGVLIWTLVEYMVHRWLFHYEPKSAWGRRFHFLAHGIHHDYPRDRTRLVMPPAVSLPMAILFVLLFRQFAGPWHLALSAGFGIGYVAYDMIHFATHHGPIPGRLGRALKAYHLRHHYRDDHRGFGVSSPLWDLVFGTLPQRKR